MDIPTITSAVTDLDYCSSDGNYSIDVLCANWTPVGAAIVEPVSRACESLAETAAMDVDTFLKRFYESQRG